MDFEHRNASRQWKLFTCEAEFRTRIVLDRLNN